MMGNLPISDRKLANARASMRCIARCHVKDMQTGAQRSTTLYRRSHHVEAGLQIICMAFISHMSHPSK